ncbi:MAG TPA: hypothetical protein VFT31_07520 [Kribbella sp.]|nr:hypothetical protein [Kribbella sp.]
MSDNLPRELHSRTSAGIQVNLWWAPADGRTWVTVLDVRTDAGFVLPVLAGEQARDVFDHPYAYAARRGVPTTARAA